MARFKARARAVDMLGRQQIAGVPTAISELFKNAHDAYADRVEVDFFRSDGLFVLRDDGFGMTRTAFEELWLTLGTESKLTTGSGLNKPPKHPVKPERPVLGEKGIGRLAIASIGPQVLVLTRAEQPVESDKLVAAFIHWGIFALPGVNLDDIEIPILDIPGGVLPTQDDVEQMVNTVRANVKDLGHYTDLTTQQTISAQLDQFRVDPGEVYSYLGKPSLLESGHGTHFFIMPADESVTAAIDGQGDDEVTSDLVKMLIGFTNTMTPSHEEPPIKAAFIDHKTNEIYDDLIGEDEFFTPTEFKNADHHIKGRFDEYGQFHGEVTVYGETAISHVVPWPAGGAATSCGPFSIDLAVVQGHARESRVPAEEWGRIVRKMNRIGGLYIYRDGIRVLPYGNTDYDFLDIEKNRTKSAAYYYFSFRRMFGVIELDGVHNKALSEKAGREGFRENKAYRQFRDILKNFFVQIAADFFRAGGTQADIYVERRAELDRIERARRKQQKQAAAKRAALAEQLDRVFKHLESGRPAEEVAKVLAVLEVVPILVENEVGDSS